MKKNRLLLFLLLSFFPTIVFASSSNSNSIPLIAAIGMEAFVSIHMSVFVLMPLARLFKPNDYKKLFMKLFLIRVVILLFFDVFVTTMIAIADFFAVFIGAFLVVPLTYFIKSHTSAGITNSDFEIINTSKSMCPRCGSMVDSNVAICTNCGANLAGTKVEQSSATCPKCGEIIQPNFKFCSKCGENVSEITNPVPKKIVTTTDFDSIYNGTVDMVLENFINRELERTHFDLTEKKVPIDVLKRKKIINILFSLSLFVFISLIFFHCDFKVYFVGLIILILFFIASKKFDFMEYLKKEIKSRPGEKISNIIMGIQNSLVTDSSNKVFFSGVVLAIFLPVILFWNPHILYEKTEDGYWVRFYTVGITNYKTVEIPSSYKNEPVIGLRGNAFSNMFFLEKATLPDTIIKINGQAFKNDIHLVDIVLPSKLEYLGGGSFYNCKSLKSIEIPDTVTDMGGEIFYNATSLESVKLSKQLPEIRGNSFENCTSLKSIEIPDSVTRIGGHAFYECTSLQTVTISSLSKLNEIGSSAFRRCFSLKEITVPKTTLINERAFKESPTNIKKHGVTNAPVDRTKYAKSMDIYLSNSRNVKQLDISLNGTFVETVYIYYLGYDFVNGLYQYNFKYKSANKEINFTLGQDNPSMEINSTFMFSLPDNYNLVTLNPNVRIIAYYN